MAISTKPKTKSVTKSAEKKVKKVAKKVVKKVVKKVAKKVAKKVVKKPVKKSAAKSVKKVIRAVAPKAVKKNTKTVTKKTPKKSTSKTPKLTSTSVMPVIGQLAPDFALKSDTAGIVSLSKYRGKNIVLYFYPKDDTPGCTRQACSFHENESQLSQKDAVVIGVSPDDVSSHAKFRLKYGFDFVLISDEGHKLANEYGVWVEKNNYGKKYMGIQRATFLIDRSGCVAYVWPKVSVDGHSEEVLAQLDKL